jgi:hypothetical protein
VDLIYPDTGRIEEKTKPRVFTFGRNSKSSQPNLTSFQQRTTMDGSSIHGLNRVSKPSMEETSSFNNKLPSSFNFTSDFGDMEVAEDSET